MRYATPTRLSENLLLTPEGFLLCPGVAIARTGTMEYAPEDLPADVAGDADIVRVVRDEDEVFAPESMASYEGKPVTVDHPDEDVTPVNWRRLACGHVQNVRRGEADSADLLLADLLITDETTIRLIREEGLREMSCGYDAQYEAVRPGVGRQTHIIGNHVALVPHGRCGSRCRINDAKERIMAAKPKNWWDRIMGDPKVRRAVKDAETEAARDMDEQGGCPNRDEEQEGQPTTDNDALAAKLDEVLAAIRGLTEKKSATDEGEPAETSDGEDPDRTEDEEESGCEKPDDGKTTDAAMRRKTADADTLSRARTLAPELAFRDADKMCVVKRAALRAVKDASARRVADSCLRGADLDSCDCLTLDAAFLAASEVMAAKNNARTADTLSRATTRDFGKTLTIADINKQNREFYAGRK